MHKAHGVIEKVQSFEKPAKHLRVIAVNPLPTGLYGVLAIYDRKVVPHIGPPKDFVNRRLEEERLAEPESEGRWAVRRADICVRHGSRIDRVARPVFARVGEMRLVEFAARNGAKPVCIDGLDFRGSFDAIRGCPVGRHIKRLVRIFRVVEVVGPENLVLGIQVVIDPAKDRTVAYGMIYRCAILLTESALHEIHKRYSLTVRISQNLRVSRGSAVKHDI